jgi:hypothetical protein
MRSYRDPLSHNGITSHKSKSFGVHGKVTVLIDGGITNPPRTRQVFEATTQETNCLHHSTQQRLSFVPDHLTSARDYTGVVVPSDLTPPFSLNVFAILLPVRNCAFA